MKSVLKYSALLSAFITVSVLADNYPNVQTYAQGIPLRGVSLAGGDFVDDNSGAPNGDFIPTLNDSALFLYRGINTYRIPVVWEYLADIGGNLKTDPQAANYLRKLSQVINDLSGKGAIVILDLHNYMRYNPNNISLDYTNHDFNGPDVIGMGGNKAPTQVAYALLWKNLTQLYHGPNMMYAIMNEPHDISNALLLSNENAAIAAIRSEEKLQDVPAHTILIDGNNWTGLHSWTGLGPQNDQPPNWKIYPAGIKDPANNYAIDVHQYFDSDGSGTYQNNDCISLSDFRNGYSYQGQQWPGFDSYWPQFTQWATTNKVKVFIGEFGSPDTTNCRLDINYFLKNISSFAYSSQQQYGVLGWLAWAAGGSWGNYVNSIAPGGPANTLMWDNALYQNYLTETQPLPALGAAQYQLQNATGQTLYFSSGEWPFNKKGSALLKPGDSAYLYPPMPINATDQIQLTYHTMAGGSVGGGVIMTQLYGLQGFAWSGVNNIGSVKATTNCINDLDKLNMCWELYGK